jgi:hypothetical protein
VQARWCESASRLEPWSEIQGVLEHAARHEEGGPVIGAGVLDFLAPGVTVCEYVGHGAAGKVFKVTNGDGVTRRLLCGWGLHLIGG